jgi:hypothetical protein
VPLLAYSVEKLSARIRRINRSALESLKFPWFEGTVALDDLRAQSFSVSRTSCFPRIFGCLSIKLKNRVFTEREFFNRIGRVELLADATVFRWLVSTPGRRRSAAGLWTATRHSASEVVVAAAEGRSPGPSRALRGAIEVPMPKSSGGLYHVMNRGI